MFKTYVVVWMITQMITNVHGYQYKIRQITNSFLLTIVCIRQITNSFWCWTLLLKTISLKCYILQNDILDLEHMYLYILFNLNACEKNDKAFKNSQNDILVFWCLLYLIILSKRWEKLDIIILVIIISDVLEVYLNSFLFAPPMELITIWTQFGPKFCCTWRQGDARWRFIDCNLQIVQVRLEIVIFLFLH